MSDVRQQIGFGWLNSSASVDDEITFTAGGASDIKAVMVFRATSLNPAQNSNDADVSCGYFDGTNQWCIGNAMINNSATRTARKAESDQHVLYVPNDDGVTVDCAMEAVAFTSNGVTLRYKIVPDASYYIGVVFFCGNGILNAEVVTPMTGVSAPVTVTLGWQPDLILSHNTFSATSVPTVGNHAYPGYGFAKRDGSTPPKQVSTSIRVRSGDNPVNVASMTTTSERIALRFNSTNEDVWTNLNINEITATGFIHEVTSDTGGNTATPYVVGYLVFRFAADVDFEIGTTEIPTTSPYTLTGLPFQPTGGLIASVVGNTGFDSPDWIEVGPISFTAFNETQIITYAFVTRDGAITTTTRSIISNSQFRQHTYTGAVNYNATDWAFTADGWSFTLTSLPANISRGIYFAFNPGSGETPISFDGFIADISGEVGTPITPVDISGEFSGTETPFTYAETDVAWPTWAALDVNTGIISGTPDAAADTSGHTVTGTDITPDTALSNSFQFLISSATTPPDVDAGTDIVDAVEGVPYQLDATVTPNDGTGLTYLWTYFNVGGRTGTFSDDSIIDPTFTADDANSEYTLTLTVSSIEFADQADSLSFTAVSATVDPIVEAGGPYSGDAGSPIQLDATVTPGTDPAPVLTWGEVTLPNPLGGTFSDPNIEDPTFTPDVVGIYTLRLTAAPNVGSNDADEATLTSNAVAPTVDAGGPYSGDVGSGVQLAGTINNGSDPAPAITWSIDSGGTGTFAPNANVEDPIFTPDSVSSYVLRLSVNPSDGNAVEDTATLESNDVAPTGVDAGGPYSGEVSTAIQLAGAYTPGSDPTPTLLWTIEAGSAGGGTFTPSASAEDPTFTPDTVGNYNLQFSVDPSDGAPVTDTATLDSQAAIVAPTVDAGGPYTGVATTAIQLDATVTPGSDASPTLLWEETSGLGGSFSDTSIEDPTFTPTIESSGYVLRLTVTPNDSAPVLDTATLDSIAGLVADLIWNSTTTARQATTEGLVCVDGQRILANPSGYEVIYSEDLGETWATKANIPLEPDYRSSKISTDGDFWYLSLEGQGGQATQTANYRSGNNADSWTTMLDGGGGRYSSTFGWTDSAGRYVVTNRFTGMQVRRWNTPQTNNTYDDSYTYDASTYNIDNFKEIDAGYVASVWTGVYQQVYLINHDLDTTTFYNARLNESDFVQWSSEYCGIYLFIPDAIPSAQLTSTFRVFTADADTANPVPGFSLTWPDDIIVDRINVADDYIIAIAVDDVDRQKMYVRASRTPDESQFQSALEIVLPYPLVGTAYWGLMWAEGTTWVAWYQSDDSLTKIIRFDVPKPPLPGLSITDQPDDAVVGDGEQVTYTVVAEGTEPLTYQWYEVTAGILVGEISDTLTFIADTLDSGNGYYVVVTDCFDQTIQSDTASLLVAVPIEFQGEIPDQFGTVGIYYNQSVSQYFIGNLLPRSYVASALPAGLSINNLNGDITGTPTAEGVVPVTITVTDSDSNVAVSNEFTITISAGAGEDAYTVGNWVGQNTSTVGNGVIQLGDPLVGYTTFEAIGDTKYWYAIVDGDNREAGKGIYNAGTFTREIIYSTILNGVYQDGSPPPLNLSGEAIIYSTFNKVAFDEFNAAYSSRHDQEHDFLGADHTSIPPILDIGYGGIVQNQTLAFTLDATWRTVDGWNEGAVSTPVKVTQDFANDGLILLDDGVWTADVFVSIIFDTNNSDRYVWLRLRNDTTGDTADPLPFFVARDQGGLTIPLGGLLFDTSAAGDLIQIQLQTDDTFAGVSITNAMFNANHNGAI